MGRLIGISKIEAKGGTPILLDEAEVGVTFGVAGDPRAQNSPRRQVTVLFRQEWEAACEDLGEDLPWTVRRANLYVEGMAMPPNGALLAIGDAVLAVHLETTPCYKMDNARPGLLDALKPDRRGGLCCSVITPGRIRHGDAVRVL